MAIWYSAMFGKIRPVQIIKETDKFVIFENGKRSAKNSDWIWYAKTKEEVKSAMVAQYELERDEIKRQLAFAEDKVNNAKNA